jgi:hypothetical protein
MRVYYLAYLLMRALRSRRKASLLAYMGGRMEQLTSGIKSVKNAM